LKDNRQRAADFFERTIRGDPEKPLVIDGLSRTRGFIQPGEKPQYAPDMPPTEHTDHQSADTASDAFDPFGGRDPLDIPGDEMWGPDGIVDTHFVLTDRGYQPKSNQQTLDSIERDGVTTDDASNARLPDGAPGDNKTDAKPSIAKDSASAQQAAGTTTPETIVTESAAVTDAPSATALDTEQPMQPDMPITSPPDTAREDTHEDTPAKPTEPPQRRVQFISRRLANRKQRGEE
jgi:hypothetical protein